MNLHIYENTGENLHCELKRWRKFVTREQRMETKNLKAGHLGLPSVVFHSDH